MDRTELFAPERVLQDPSGGAPAGRGAVPAAPRLVTANRRQMYFRCEDLDALLAEDHRARLLWALLEKVDLSTFYEWIAAREGEPGRPAIDPRIVVTLWVYATAEGVGSARKLAKQCETDDAYRWICGGVSVNHHTLSDFRVGQEKALDDLMTRVLAVLLGQGVLELKRVAQDGMRVRASAGAASFHRERTLEERLAEAREQVEATKRQEEREKTETARQRAAAQRAAQEAEWKVRRALAELSLVRATKPGAEQKAEARVSTTDPEARVMKMADGGFRPAYNVQLETETESRVIVGVQVTNSGSDKGQVEPMLEEVERRTGTKPEELLVDGGFVKLESIEHASEVGVKVYAPVPEPKAEGVDRYEPKDGDSPAVAEWRQRMGTEEAKAIYKERAATAETTNADLRVHRSLDRLPVRGIKKVLCVALWASITYNLLRCIALGVPLLTG